jgi:hypothetical protein
MKMNDIETLEASHEGRFLKKLKPEKSNWKRFVSIGIASIYYARVSIFNTTPKKKRKNWWFASQEKKQTDSIFTILIEK